MKIIDIEAIPIYPRLAKRYDNLAGRVRMGGIDSRTVFRVKTDNGIVGYGDARTGGDPLPPRSMFEPLIGRNPFDYMNNRFNFGLASALYDVMGKYLEVPVYKLLGQKVRDAGTVAAWTRPCAPDVFAGEIRRAVDEGYTIFKMHTHARFDPVEQAQAAMDVAPPGFKIHFDFNGSGRTLGAVLPLVKLLEAKCPIVAYIEDPFPKTDIESWRALRAKSNIPIVHGAPPVLGGFGEMMGGMADIYMLGGRTFADVMAHGIACGRANFQTILQLTGGTLMKAMTLHMAAVLPTASGHSINLDDQYEEDITTERIPVIEGFSPVPERPGLGYEVDEAALKRLAGQHPTKAPRVVGILRLPNGRQSYTQAVPSVERTTGTEEGVTRGISFDVWEDDGSPEFARAYEQVQSEASAKRR